MSGASRLIHLAEKGAGKTTNDLSFSLNVQESLSSAFIWICSAIVIKMGLDCVVIFSPGGWKHAHAASSAAMFIFMFFFVGVAYGTTIWSFRGTRGSGGAIRAFRGRLLVICTYVMAHI